MANDIQEYLRRNLILAKAEGVKAAMVCLYTDAPKRTPLWLLWHVSESIGKMDDIIKELMDHRSEVPRQD